MANPSFPTVWYFVVGDTNPTTQVWETSSGGLVANNAANYLSWVANGGSAFRRPDGKQISVSNVANNGSGKNRLTVSDTSRLTNGDAWVTQNTGTAADGEAIVTVINSTTVDLSSAFVSGGAVNGVIDRGEFIATAALLSGVIDNYNRYLSPVARVPVAQTISANLALSNNTPWPLYVLLTATAPGLTATLPAASLFGSLPFGVPCVFANPGANDITINDNSGAFLFTLAAGSTNWLWLTSNTTPRGVFNVATFPPFDNTQTTAGDILVGQGTTFGYGRRTVHGDGTLAPSGAFTLTKVNACKIYLNNNQAINTGSATKVNYDTKDFDPDGIADVTTNHRITPNRAGTFQVNMNGYAIAGGMTTLYVIIAKNGTQIVAITADVDAFGEAAAQASTLVQMNGTTDFIEGNLQIFGANGSITAGERLNSISLVRVGP